MKTGRLLKFVRAGAEIQAYIYRDGPVVHGTIYVVAPGTTELKETTSLQGAHDAAVERDVRVWIDAHYPAKLR